MSKAILVLDEAPSSCYECQLHNYHFCDVNGESINEERRPDHCPLKEAPEYEMVWHEDETSDWERGYNSCLKEILGE